MSKNLKKSNIPLTVLFFSIICLLSSVFCSPGYSAVPHLINYQGRLTDTSGQPLNGLYNITFRIYDAENSGNLLWQGTYNSISITKGIFNILLGDGSDTGFDFSTLAFDKPYWLEIKVGSDNPMTPRQRITSAAYAIRAERLTDEPLPAARGGTGSTVPVNTANGVVVLDANNKLPTVDGSQLTGLAGFGAWVSGLAKDIAYHAATDGFVCAYAAHGGGGSSVEGYTDSSASPTTLRVRNGGGSDAAGSALGITMPVRKGDFWKVTSADYGSDITVYWIPLGK